MDNENKKAFPPGSLIAGFRRQKNIGEIIAPSKPIRVARGEPEGGRGCYPCNAPRSCILHESGALQSVSSIQSGYDGVVHRIYKHLECTTPNLVYHIRWSARDWNIEDWCSRHSTFCSFQCWQYCFSCCLAHSVSRITKQHLQQTPGWIYWTRLETHFTVIKVTS